MQQKMFLIKKSNGVIYNFYFSKNGGICYKVYSLHNNEKIDPFETSITDEKILEFHVNIDKKDVIHILCLTENGDLKYFFEKDEIWDTKFFVHFDLSSNIVNSLFIHVSNEKLFIIYAASSLMNVNLWTIYFKSWDGIKWNKLNIGMTICYKDFSPYLISVDSQENFHIIYKNSGSNGSQLYYKKFHMQFSLWSTSEKIVGTAEAIGYYYVFSDTENNLHLIWSTALNKTYKIQYRIINSKILNHNRHNRIITLSTSKHIYLQPVIYETDKKILAIWKYNGAFYGCDIDQTGLSCGNEFTIPYSDHGTPVLVEYKSNFALEKGNFNGNLLYGITGDYIDLILPENFTCDFLDTIPDEIQEDETEAFSYAEITHSKDISTHSDEDMNTNNNNNIVEEINIQEKINKDNKSLTNPIDKSVTETNNEQLLRILEEIKTQNSILIKSFEANTTENKANEKQKKVNILRKLANIFRNN